MFEVMFFDKDDGFIRKAYAQSLEDVFNMLQALNVDFEDHFVKVRLVRK